MAEGKPKRTLRIAILIILLILSGLAGFVWDVHRNPEGVIHPRLIPPDYHWLDKSDGIYSKTGVLAIAGREFRIPVAYVDGRFKDGRKEDSIVLLYMLPEFKSYLEFSKEDRRKMLWDGYKAGMLLEAASVRPPLKQQVENGRSYPFKIEIDDDLIHGLVREKRYGGDEQAPVLRDELFLKYDADGNVTDYIRCSLEERVKIPSCRHKFIDKKLVYRIRYNKKRYLSHWREQRALAIAFIDSFEITNTQPKEGNKP